MNVQLSVLTQSVLEYHCSRIDDLAQIFSILKMGCSIQEDGLVLFQRYPFEMGPLKCDCVT